MLSNAMTGHVLQKRSKKKESKNHTPQFAPSAIILSKEFYFYGTGLCMLLEWCGARLPSKREFERAGARPRLRPWAHIFDLI